MLTNLLYVLIAIVLLGVIIIVHELGHYAIGRLCGIGVVEFSVGFGPKLFGWKRKGIDYSVRVLPFGGYCKFVGEDDDNSAPNAMNRMPVWKRFLTVFAGPAMNFVLAYLAAVVMLCMFYGTVEPRIETVVADMPAAEAQLQPGDVIIAANGTDITFDADGASVLRGVIRESDSVELTILRNGETVTATLVPKQVVTDETTGETTPQIGVTFGIKPISLGAAIPEAGRYLYEISGMMLDSLRNLIFKGQGADQMAGAIGTVAVASEIMQTDRSMILYFVVILSLNLGIINLLPLPALDGGRLVFLIVEGIRRKPVPPEKEGMVHAIGLMLFFLLAIVLAWHDIVTYVIK